MRAIFVYLRQRARDAGRAALELPDYQPESTSALY